MTKRTVVIGFLGTQLDAGQGAGRWEKWRPTLSLMQHDDTVIDGEISRSMTRAGRRSTGCRTTDQRRARAVFRIRRDGALRPQRHGRAAARPR